MSIFIGKTCVHKLIKRKKKKYNAYEDLITHSEEKVETRWKTEDTVSHVANLEREATAPAEKAWNPTQFLLPFSPKNQKHKNWEKCNKPYFPQSTS